MTDPKGEAVPTYINGLPPHVLLLHVVVVLIPLGALFTVLSATWPIARRKLGFLSPLTCLIALAFVPLTVSAGRSLRGKIDADHANPQITKHLNLATWMLPFAILLFLVSAAVWWLGRKTDEAATAAQTGATGGATTVATRTRTVLPTWVGVAIAVVAVAVAAVNVLQIYRVGDSGAHAAWDYVQKIK